MIGLKTGFFVAEFIEDIDSDVIFILDEMKYKNIQGTHLWGHISVCGLDRDLNNSSPIFREGDLLAFCFVKQTKIPNKSLLKKEFNRIHREEWHNIKLTKSQKSEIMSEAENNICPLLRVKIKYTDVLIDIKSHRVFIQHGRDSDIFDTIDLLRNHLSLLSIFVRPWFNSSLSDMFPLGKLQMLFFIWLYQYTSQKNPSYVSSGKKVSFYEVERKEGEKGEFPKYSSRRISLSGDISDFFEFWKKISNQKKIKEISLIFKSNFDSNKSYKEVDDGDLYVKYRVTLREKNFGFTNFSGYGGDDIISGQSVEHLMSTFNSFIKDFDQLIIDFSRFIETKDLENYYAELTNEK